MNNNLLSTSEKRKQTILKKRETKQNKKMLYASKQLVKHNEILKNVIVDDQPLLRNVLKVIRYKNTDIKQLGFKYKQQSNSTIKINIKRENMSKDTIRELAERVRQVYIKEKKNVLFEVNLRYPEAWRTGQITNIDEDIHMFDPVEYEDLISSKGKKYNKVDQQTHFNEFEIFIINNNKKEGGASDDDNNNCFYNCLYRILFKSIPWKSPYDMKKFLDLPYDSMVGIIHIPLIEKKLKDIKINVVGDYIYNSRIISNKVIYLKLVNEHYSLITKSNYHIEKMIHYKGKLPLLYNKMDKTAYDGNKEFLLSNDARDDIYNNKLNNKYIIVNKEYKDQTFKEEYDNFIIIADNLLKASNNEISLYKTGNYKNTSLNLFDKYNKHIETDKIEQLESEYINNSSIGALIFSKPYDGVAYKFDEISFYPSMMNSSQKYPIKEGQFKQISTAELNNIEYVSYGIYRCIITRSDENTINKLFRFNPKNYYTHIDIKVARELKLNIKMIEDDENNFLYYASNTLISGKELFSKFISVVFPLKELGIEGSKPILSMLWGSLCQTQLKKHCIKIDSNERVDDNLTSIKSSLFNDDILLKTVKADKFYKFNYARLKPFLISKGRSIMSNLMKPYINTVIRVHTDGFTVSKYPENIKVGSSLGELRYEGKCDNYNVINCNKFSGKFII